MWCPNRLNHLAQKTIHQVQLAKSRPLHSHSAWLAPRGYRNYEREQVSTFTDKTVVVNSTATNYQNVSQAHSRKIQKHSQSIDDMDPVVLKYTNMIIDMKTPVSEKVNITNFGSIRFDHENIPKVHGQFEEECFSNEEQKRNEFDDTVTDILKNPSRVSIEERILATDESINDFYFLNDNDTNHVSGIKYVDQISQEACFTEAEETKAPTNENTNTNDTNLSHAGEMNYIDEQVFNDAYSKYSSSSSTKTKEPKPANENINDTTSSPEGMNYIDEQVFNDAYSRYLRPSTSEENEVESVKRDTMVEKLPKSESSSQDLDYIDKFYFGNSMETMSENKKSFVQFSVVKNEIESSLTRSESLLNEYGIGKAKDNQALHSVPNLTDAPEILYDPKDKAGQGAEKVKDSIPKAEPTPTSAFDFVAKKRREEHDKEHGVGSAVGSKKSYKKILSLVNDHRKEGTTKYEMFKTLKNSIVFDNYDVIGLYKPYGLVMHPGTDSPYHTLVDFLPDLATFLKTEKLYPIHRLDATTTGIVLLARTPAMADTLKGMLKDRKLKKTYWAITKGIPKPPQGVIDIPISEGSIDKRRRMVLKPDVKGLKSTSSDSRQAVTSYEVLSGRFNSALVECYPMTGVKHQVRVHLGFGLGCPVLGDHKYSHLRKLAPQRLPGDTLDRLRIKQSQVRKLPMFLHSKQVIIPELNNGKDVYIWAKLPAFFNKAIDLLHLNRKTSKLAYTQLSEMQETHAYE